MNNIKEYTYALELRNISKKIQQLSWSLSAYDKKFAIEELTTDEIKTFIKGYETLLEQFTKIQNEIKK